MNSDNLISTLPPSVRDAIDEVKNALARQTVASEQLFESVVKVVLACHTESYSLKGVELARLTGASTSYISQTVRAAQTCLAKKRPVLEEALKLGYKKFVRKYVQAAPQRNPKKPKTDPAARPALKVIAQAPVVELARTLHDQVRERAATLSLAERDLLLQELLDMVADLRHAQGAREQNYAGPERRAAH